MAPPSHGLFQVGQNPGIFLQRVFRIYPKEVRLLLWVTAIQLVMRGSSILINNLAQTAFIKRYGVEHLPTIFLIEAVLTFFFTTGIGVLMERHKTTRVFTALFIFFAGSVGLIRVLIPFGSNLVYPALFILKSQSVEILPILYWDILTDLFTSQQAKRLYTLITAGGILGTTLGSLMTDTVAQWVGMDNVLLVFVGGMLLAAFLNELTEKVAGAPLETRIGRSRVRFKKDFKKDFLEFLAFSRRSALLRYLILITAIPNILLPIMTYQFNVVVDQFFVSEQATLRFFGIFRGVSNAVMFISLLFSGRLVSRWGVASSLLFHPINYLVSFAALYFRFDIFSGIYARFTSETLKTVLNNPARAILYNFFPSQVRGFVRVFLRGNVVRAADFAGSGFLMLVTGLLDPRLLSMVAAPLVVLWILTSVQIKRRYPSMLMDSLRDGQLDLKALEVIDIPAWVQDKGAVGALYEGLRGRDHRGAVVCGEILARIKPPGWVRSLVESLPGKPPEAQKTLLDLLRPEDAGEAADGLVSLAGTAQPDSLVHLVSTLSRLDASAGSVLAKGLLGHPEPKVQVEVLSALYLGGDPESVSLFRLQIQKQIEKGPAGICMVADVIGRVGDPFFSGLLLDWVGGEDADLKACALTGLAEMRHKGALAFALEALDERRPLQVRRAAVQVLNVCREQAPARVLIDLLGDEDPVVRARASQAIQERGEGVLQSLLGALASPSRTTKNEVLEILDKVGISSVAFSTFIVNEVRAAYCHLALAHFLRGWDRGYAASLLADHLLEKCDEGVEVIFRVLAATEFKDRMKVIIKAIHSGNRSDMDNAIEALDSSLSPKIRKALIPLLEERPLEEKLSLGRKRFGIDSFTPEKAALALSELLRSEDSTSRVLTLCVLELQKGDGIGLDGKPSLAQGTAQRTQGGDSPGEGFSAVEKALVVRKIPIFHKLRVQEIMAIAEIAQAKSCQAGDVVLREGDMGDALFLVMEGELSVVKREGTAQEIRLDTIRKDECFGEMSLIDQEPRSATIKAETDTLLLQIKGGDFLAIMKKYPRIPLYLCKILCSRLRSLQRMLTPGGTPSHAPFRSGFVLENEVVAHRICGG